MVLDNLDAQELTNLAKLATNLVLGGVLCELPYEELVLFCSFPARASVSTPSSSSSEIASPPALEASISPTTVSSEPSSLLSTSTSGPPVLGLCILYHNGAAVYFKVPGCKGCLGILTRLKGHEPELVAACKEEIGNPSKLPGESVPQLLMLEVRLDAAYENLARFISVLLVVLRALVTILLIVILIISVFRLFRPWLLPLALLVFWRRLLFSLLFLAFRALDLRRRRL
mmetsp:Transcript_8052/g.18823  ORF Transcript_8052/g.18823 Transcript_8052/m.18823 type:complete len:229 (-) Transcript_8052:158-844(-)